MTFNKNRSLKQGTGNKDESAAKKEKIITLEVIVKKG